MKNFIIFLSLICVSIAHAQMQVIVIDENSLPYDLSPSKYENSASNYDNSSSKYDNSESKYDNSPSKYDNSRSNYENSNGKNRLITSDGSWAGYTVYADDGLLNIFNSSGSRFGYVPGGGHTQSIFRSLRSQWCGTLGVISGKPVVALTRSCYFELISKR
jgi:hypothetical protein